jgi:hypothetical protein
MYAKKNKREQKRMNKSHHASLPKIAESDFKALSRYWRAGRYYAIFTSHAPSFGDVVARWHGLCVPLRRQNLHQNLCARSKINLRTQCWWCDIILMMLQSTSLLSPRPNRVFLQPPASPNTPILMPYHTSLRGVFPGGAFSSACSQQHYSLYLCKKNNSLLRIPPPQQYPQPLPILTPTTLMEERKQWQW